MTSFCVKAESLTKKFVIVQKERTLYRNIKALVQAQQFKGDLWALRDLNFEIKQGEKIAIVGKNGSGKTTLFRILSGIYVQTSGHLELACKPRPLFSLWTGMNNDLSLVDNIYLFGAVHGMSRKNLTELMDTILNTAELYPMRFTLFKNLSSGQQQRLAFSTFFQNTNKFLIFDECLAYIDASFSRRCNTYFENLMSSDKTIMIASHNTHFLKNFCTKALWLEAGRIRMFDDINRVIAEYQQSS